MQRRIGNAAVVATLFVAATLAATTAWSETAHASQPSTIQVDAEGRIEAEPDLVTLNVSVVSEAHQSAEAVSANAATTEAVLAALREAAGDEAEIKTTGYSVTPRFEQFEPSTPRRLVGYRVRNSVVLASSDLKGIGQAIDAAVAAGANDIDSLTFQLRDDFEIRLQALAEATRRARAKADAIAKALGKRVARVVAVESGGGFSTPLRVENRFRASAKTPVAVGSLDVRARVSMQVELED